MKDEEKDLEEALKIVTGKVLEQLSTVQLGELKVKRRGTCLRERNISDLF